MVPINQRLRSLGTDPIRKCSSPSARGVLRRPSDGLSDFRDGLGGASLPPKCRPFDVYGNVTRKYIQDFWIGIADVFSSVRVVSTLPLGLRRPGTQGVGRSTTNRGRRGIGDGAGVDFFITLDEFRCFIGVTVDRLPFTSTSTVNCRRNEDDGQISNTNGLIESRLFRRTIRSSVFDHVRWRSTTPSLRDVASSCGAQRRSILGASGAGSRSRAADTRALKQKRQVW